MNKHSKPHRKALGAYYTPINLSKVLCEWAVRSASDLILEPSFGGCGFLEASVERLSGLGSANPISQICGVDIDPAAFDFLSEKLGDFTNLKKQFLYNDFIQVSSDEFNSELFDVVLGNPPYVSLHNMSKEQKISCFELLRNSEFAKGTIGRNASLWAFFLLHSLSFLKCGGRCAWVLPSSLLHADYASAVLNVFKKHFSLIKIIKLNDRFFQGEDADEISVILFADGFSKVSKPPSNIGFSTAQGANELDLLCRDITLDSIINSNYKVSLVPKNTLYEYEKLCSSGSTQSLGELSKIVIGMVTGDNKTFVLDRKSVLKNNLQEIDLKPVVGRFSLLRGLIHNKKRHNRAQAENHKAYLVCPETLGVKNSFIRKYLAKVPKDNRKNNRTFAKREHWYYPDDARSPDAFLTYMIHKLPRLVINNSNINCTNSIHRVFFNEEVSQRRRKAIAISMLSSFSQLSAEIEGRAYGSGVLKLEPSAAKKIQVLITLELEEILNAYETKLDRMISQGSIDEAQTLVDQLLADSLKISHQTMLLFSKAVVLLREERYRGLCRTVISKDDTNET